MSLLHNSVEWIEQSTVQLFSLSPTHDSTIRAPAGKIAYFDNTRTWNQGGATYNSADASDMTGIETTHDNVAGHMSGNQLAFFDARRESENSIADTFIHEIQHFCDSGPAGSFEYEAPQRTSRYDAPQWAYNQYQSEFRARTIDPVVAPEFGTPDAAAPRQLSLTATRKMDDPKVSTGQLSPSESVRTGLWNERQVLVFEDLVPDTSITVWYDYPDKTWTATYAYLPHFYVLDPKFRDMVDNYAEPILGTPLSGGNMVNSVRIDALAVAIESGKSGEDIKITAAGLDTIDLEFLRDFARAAPFWDLAREHLSLALFHWLRTFIRTTGGDSDLAYQWITTVSGDSLSLLAGRYLGDLGRWEELYQLNKDVIGSDPDLLQIGIELRVPLA